MMDPVDAPAPSTEERAVDAVAWLDAHWKDAVKRLWVPVVRLAKSEAAAEDLFQEVYIKIYTRKRTIDPGKHPVTVVKSAVGTEYMNSIGRPRAKNELPADSQRDARAPDSAPAPDSQIRRLQRSRARAAALDRAVAGDAMTTALLAAARGDVSVDPYALGDEKAVQNGIRRLRYAIERVDAEEEQEDREP